MKTIINPFTKEIIISKDKNSIELTYEDIDEWNSFKLDEKIYDIHILYDSGLDISIYPVKNNKVDYSKSIKNTVKVIY